MHQYWHQQRSNQRCSRLVVVALLTACTRLPVAERKATLPAATTTILPTGAPTTLDQLELPQQGRLSGGSVTNPDSPAALTRLLLGGFGNIVQAPGRAATERTFPGDSPAAAGANRTRVVRFAHLTDLQLADDESPARMAILDSTLTTNAAFRAQEGYECILVNAAVHTINALDRADPVDFVLLGGDSADNAQQNEIDWALGILDGGNVHCDSGDANDIVPGPGNDQKDAFVAEGLNKPYYWITGNHDVNMQGIFAITSNLESLATGTDPSLGTRDYRLPGAPITTDPVPADAARHLLSRPELMAKVAADGNGHGIGPAQVALGKAFYSFDAGPLRFVIMDTASETGGDLGVLHRADVDAFVKPALDQAVADKKMVVIASHHAIDALTLNGGEHGATIADAISGDDWVTFLSGYPNIVLSMVAHTHMHRVTAVQSGAFSLWEVMTSALADFPNQFHMMEIWDEDNGWLTVRATAVDYLDDDPLAAQGRELGFADYASGWGLDGGGDPNDANVVLWVKKPAF